MSTEITNSRHEKSSPVFVLGTQRSGTTLLNHMLNSHPRIFMVNEFWHLYPHVTGEIEDSARLEELLVSHLRLPGSYADRAETPLQDTFDHIESAFAASASGRHAWPWCRGRSR